MPPASPVPGWSSGDVCTVTIARRRGAGDPPRPRITVIVTLHLHQESNRGSSCPIPSEGTERRHLRSKCPFALLRRAPACEDAHMSAPERGTAVVTGASSGIGAATARRLAAEGFQVVAAARRRERLDALCAEIGARAVTLDVTSADSVAALAQEVRTAQVLVNNAGMALGM